ncbi:MAG TPA: UDP-2,3-diacylglucosamine diphosphatase [Thermoplasmata archaeon]|nr:UDP-2,3-diacylglucosamine diphosphatase [Thermoplasmata archaeon]
MIIVVSDVHLGYEKSDKKNFEDFITNYVSEITSRNDCFILLGDIFDFWRKKNLDCFLRSDAILKKILSLDAKIYYVVGNHDYYMLKLMRRFEEYEAFEIRKHLRLNKEGIPLLFIHGYELDVFVNYEPMTLWEYEKISEELCGTRNLAGKIMSELWGLKRKIKRPPGKRKSWTRGKRFSLLKVDDMGIIEKFALSAGKNILLGMKRNEKLIFGHTHRPFLSEDTANTGSWVKDALPEYEIDTYIKIEDKEIKLNKWENGREREIKTCIVE